VILRSAQDDKKVVVTLNEVKGLIANRDSSPAAQNDKYAACYFLNYGDLENEKGTGRVSYCHRSVFCIPRPFGHDRRDEHG
jgi:hypothetical protein